VLETVRRWENALRVGSPGPIQAVLRHGGKECTILAWETAPNRRELYIRRQSMKEELEFYDVKSRSKFKTMDWRIETKMSKGQTRFFAVAKSPMGTHEAWRIVSADFAKSHS
jgi:hypothetical protein